MRTITSDRKELRRLAECYCASLWVNGLDDEETLFDSHMDSRDVYNISSHEVLERLIEDGCCDGLDIGIMLEILTKEVDKL